ncbi:DinB family protein, partial [Planococcus sp. SIMBA_143]
WLYTHTATHEFHHKGQIVKIGRKLGYIPPDTDLIEP